MNPFAPITSEEEPVEAFALVRCARVGATPIDIYGTSWGQVPADVGPEALHVTGKSDDHDSGRYLRRPVRVAEAISRR